MDALFANDTDRTIRGRLLPYGEPSRLNITGEKPLMFSRGTVKLPRDPQAVWLNLEHDRYTPIGRATELIETEAGIDVVFAIDDTDEGDAALAAVKSGRLSRLSAEITDLFRAGANAVKSRLSGAGLVTEGAFASAALFAILGDPEADPEAATCPDCGAQLAGVDSIVHNEDGSHTANLPAPEPATTDQPAPPATDPAPAEPAPAEPSAERKEDAVPDTSAPVVATVPAPAPFATPAAPTPEKVAPQLFARRNALQRIAGAQGTGEDMQLAMQFFAEQGNLFALNDVAYDGAGGVGDKMVQPQWLGENRGPDYIQRFIPLFNRGTLTSLKLGGFKWGVKPAGGTWAGNKAPIASNTPTIIPETDEAIRWAGGHDIAREHKDFNTPGFFESYDYWMRRSFWQWLDVTLVLTEALAGATDIEADDPTDLAIGAALSQMIDGAAAVINAGYTPTFAALDTNGWKTIAKIPHSDVLGYLNAQISLRVDGGDGSNRLDAFKIVPAPVGTITAGHVLVGSKDAATVYTLPGDVIRAEAVNISQGGLDYGYFGYGGLKIEDPLALVDVAPFTA